LLKTRAKAVITTAEIVSTTLTATRSCLPPETPIIVIDDKTGPIPEGLIPFDVSISESNINMSKLIILKVTKGNSIIKWR
jgi:hypothetical protein